MGKISRHRSGSIAEAKAKVRNIPRAEMLASPFGLRGAGLQGCGAAAAMAQGAERKAAVTCPPAGSSLP